MDVGLGDYALGVAGLAAIAASLGLAAARVRARLLPGWRGAPAWLADAILALGALILISELLGLIGILMGVPLVIVSVVAGGAVFLGLGRAAGGPPRVRGEAKPRVAPEGAPPAAPEPRKDWQAIAAAAISLLVAAQWAVPTL
jgi:hypothetical protein